MSESDRSRMQEEWTAELGVVWSDTNKECTGLTFACFLAARYGPVGWAQQLWRTVSRKVIGDSDIAAIHANYFLELTRAARIALRTQSEPAWSRAIHVEFDNIRVAYDWLVAHRRIGDALELVWSLSDDVLMRARHEVAQWAETLADDPAAMGHRLRPAALGLASNAALVDGDIEHAEQLARRALDSPGQPAAMAAPGRWIAANTLALVAANNSDQVSYRARLNEAVELGQAEGDPRAAVIALYERVMLRWQAGRSSGGERTVARLGNLVDCLGVGASPSMRAMAELARGMACGGEDPATARRHLDRGMDLAAAARNTPLFLQGRRAAHRLVLPSGDQVEAVRRLHELAEDFRRRGNVNEQLQTTVDLLWHLIELDARGAAAVIAGHLSACHLSPTSYGTIEQIRLAERDLRRGWTRDPRPASNAEGQAAWDRGAVMSPDDLAAFVTRTIDELTVPPTPVT